MCHCPPQCHPQQRRGGRGPRGHRTVASARDGASLADVVHGEMPRAHSTGAARLRSHEASAQTGSGGGGRDEEGVRPLLPGGHCSPAAAPSSQVPCSEKRRFRPARLEGVSVEGTSSRQSRRISHGLRPDRTRSRSAGAAHQAGPKPTAPPCGPSPPLSQRVTLISVRSLKATMWKLVPSACGLEPAPSGVPGSGLRPSSVKGTRRRPRRSSQGPM